MCVRGEVWCVCVRKVVWSGGCEEGSVERCVRRVVWSGVERCV